MNQIPEELQERIAAYIDGQLSPAEAARLEVYLANTDAQLADQVIGMIGDKHAVHGLPRPTAPHDLSARVMEQIERASLLHDVEHISPQRSWWQSRGMIAASLAIVLGGFSYFIMSSVLGTNADWRKTEHGPLASRGDFKSKEIWESTQKSLTHGPTLDAIHDDLAKNTTQESEFDARTMRPLDGNSIAAAKGGTDARLPATVRVPERELMKTNVAATDPVRVASAPPESPAIGNQAGEKRGGEPTRATETQIVSAQPVTPEFSSQGPGMPNGEAFGGTSGGGAGGRGGRGGGGGGRSPGGTGMAGGGRGVRGLAAAPASSEPPPAQKPLEEAAVAAVTRAAGDQPVLLTFIARDDQDFAKLTSTLETYGIANRREALVTNALGANIRNNYYDMQTQYGNIQSNNELRVGNTNTVGNQAGIRPQNNGQNGLNNFGGASSEQINRQNSVIINNGTPEYAQQSGNRPAGQSANTAIALSSGGPLRVTLKHEQINELTSQFHLGVIARGSDTYVFKAIGDRAPVTASAAGRNTAYRNAGYSDEQIAAENKRTITVANPTDRNKDTNDATQTAISKNGETPASTAPLARDVQNKKENDWVECVITMEPATAPVTPANTPADAGK